MSQFKCDGNSVFKLLIIVFNGLTFAVILSACEKKAVELARVNTGEITAITANTAQLNNIIEFNGGSEIIERGVCWNSIGNPVIDENHTNDGIGSGGFLSIVTELLPRNPYFIRAYATNARGTAYGETRQFTTLDLTVTDVDSNIYQTTEIGTQIWITENLKTTKYNDGFEINLVSEDSQWRGLSSGAYCWYNNKEEEYKDIYGPLYNWYAVNTGKLCPTGWHVPSDEEWSVLTDYLGGESVAGGKLKEEGTNHWRTPNTGASDEVGFSAVPGGLRMAYGYWGWDDDQNYLWSSTDNSNIYAWGRMLSFDSTRVNRWYYNRRSGFSVRCLKD